MRWLLFVLLISRFSVLYAEWLLFESPFNAYGNDPIMEIAIVGERCSGTNYLEGLMMANFPSIRVSPYIYAHKHFYPWFDLTEFGFPHLTKPARFPLLQRSKNCLFVLIVRNSVDWIKSFYATPHHVDKSLTKQGRLHFMSHTWKGKIHPCPDDRNPFTGQAFKNVLELRKFKILNNLKIGKIVNNFIVIRYETLMNSPQQFIESVAHAFGLDYPAFVNFGADHKKSIYPPLSPRAKEFLLKEVDWETERLVGYTREDAKNSK